MSAVMIRVLELKFTFSRAVGMNVTAIQDRERQQPWAAVNRRSVAYRSAGAKRRQR